MKKGLLLLGVLTTLLAVGIWQTRKPAEAAHTEIKETESGARTALRAWATQRSYPGKVFPRQGFFKGFEHSSQILQKRSKPFKAKDTWTTMGPANHGGRTNALVVDPNNPDILYAGTATGGLWRMNINGNDYTWTFIDTDFPVLGVNAIAVDPGNSNVIYIGTGEVYAYQNSIGNQYERLTRGSYGIGILKSVDAGATWVKSLDWAYNQERGVLSMKINPLNPQVVFAGTSEGLFKSTNAGASWVLVNDVLMAVDIRINPADTSVIYVSHGNLDSPGMGIYRSLQGGAAGSFTKLAGGLPQTWSGKTLLAVCPDEPDVLYADIANDTTSIGLYYSANRGNTWTLRTNEDVASYQGWFSHYVRVNPENCDAILMAGTHYYRSTNGGTTLTNVGGIWPNNTLHLDHHTYADHPEDVNTVFIGHDGGVSRSTNGGQSFVDMSQGYISTQFNPGFASSPTDPNVAVGGLQDNQVQVYRGTLNWDLYTTGDGAFNAIDPGNDDIMYASNQRLWLTKSTDGGYNWNYIAFDLQVGTAAFVAPFLVSPSEPNILYAGGDHIFKTTNRGNNWSTMNGGDPLTGGNMVTMAISHTDSDLLYLTSGPGTNGRTSVHKTVNGANSFTDITGNLPDRFYVDLVVSPLDDQVVYLTLSGFGTPHVYWSDNGGSSWTNIGDGLPDVPTQAVMVSPENPDHIYVGNDLGVYVSVDHGATWHTFKEGMPTASMVMDLSLSLSNNKIRAVTHGNGVYERSLLPSDTVISTGPAKATGDNRLWQQQAQGETRIGFSLARQEYVSFMIFDLKGKVVKSWPVKSYASGESTLTWDRISNTGQPVGAGSYICRMRAGKVYKSVTLRL